MSVYHQIGHNSENLLFEAHLRAYRGAILSPVNYSKTDTASQVNKIREDLDDFEVIFDPQVYCPTADKATLKEWDYYPQDVETADTSDLSWWTKLVERILASSQAFKPNRICSPAIMPRQYSNAYYDLMVQVADYCSEKAECDVSLTAIVKLSELASPTRPLEIASILTKAQTNAIYLVFVSDVEPRRELSDAEELKGAMRLIRALSQADMSVLVGFCATDILLWRFAGATSFATGKFFNLRRFTAARFEEPKAGGGGQLPYWFEENLIGHLRESDLLRIEKIGLLSQASKDNPFSEIIFEQLRAAPPKPWVAFAWRHYLYWFADFDARCIANQIDTKAMLKSAEENWLVLEDKEIFMEEARNDGKWIRSWRRAISEAFAVPAKP